MEVKTLSDKKKGFLFFANIAEDTGENSLSKLGL